METACVAAGMCQNVIISMGQINALGAGAAVGPKSFFDQFCATLHSLARSHMWLQSALMYMSCSKRQCCMHCKAKCWVTARMLRLL